MFDVKLTSLVVNVKIIPLWRFSELPENQPITKRHLHIEVHLSVSYNKGSLKVSLLEAATFRYPIIDNHCHNLLNASQKDSYQLHGITTEAQGDALGDSPMAIASYRAVLQLAKLFRCEPTMEAVRAARNALPYEELCRICFEPTGIASLLLDDLMDNIPDLCYDYKWHDRLTSSPTKRIIRVEVLAQDLIKGLASDGRDTFRDFAEAFSKALDTHSSDPDVTGFKSVVCYRTGLDVQKFSPEDTEEQFKIALQSFKETGRLRVSHKALNDFIVNCVLKVSAISKKPVQFHTGLGDNDITLTKSNPAIMQALIKEHPDAIIVLLHSSYPFSREAGYLASVYKNVYLDFGEVFPMVSRDGQTSIIRQVLELTPTNKLLWSTDGHWWPESYYLAVVQVRETLYEVLSHSVTQGDMTESQAAKIVENVFYHNSNRLYKLGLPSDPPLLSAIPTTGPSSPLGKINVKRTLNTLEHSRTRFIRIHFVDYNNIIRRRIIPIERIKEMVSNSSAAPRAGVSLTKACLGMLDGTTSPAFSSIGEYLLEIDWHSLRPPSYRKGHAFAMGNLEERVSELGSSGLSKLAICPRNTLNRIVEEAKEKDGIVFLVGFRIIFVFLGGDSNTPVTGPAYGTKTAETLDEIAADLETSGIILEEYHSEARDGQFEIVTGPLPTLEAVDGLILTREIISTVAEKYGFKTSFFPKPSARQYGSTVHTRISLLTERESPIDSVAPITELEASFLRSLLDHLPAICAFTLASPASYRPNVHAHDVVWVCWGSNNLEVPVSLYRSKEQGWNFEVNIADGTGNPYLGVAAMLQAGLLGIRKGLRLNIPDKQVISADNNDEKREKIGVAARIPLSNEAARYNLQKDTELSICLGKELVEKYLSATGLRGDIVFKLSDEEHKAWMLQHY